MRVADFIALHLKSIGVDTVFMVAGGGMMYLVDAVGRAGLPHVSCHHEQCCAMAAEGYAKRGDRLGVAYATSGPGATNLLTGIAGAWLDSSPVLLITGQSKRSQTIRAARTEGLRQFGTFEVDIVPMVAGVTKYARFIDDPNSIRHHLEKAIHLALDGRPGPVLLDIPLDVQGWEIDPDTLVGFTPPAAGLVPDPTIAVEVFRRLAAARRPVLFAGSGVRRAGVVPAFQTLVERLGVPTVLTQAAKDCLPHDHPLFVGHGGPKGDRAGNFALQGADLILSLGNSLHSQSVGYDVDLFAPSAAKIQVDLDAAVLDRGDVPVDLRVLADVGAMIEGLAAAAPAPLDLKEWRRRCAGWKIDFAVRNEPHLRSPVEVNLYDLVEALSEALPGGETIVTDAGSCFYALGQAFRCRGGQRYIVSAGLGAMGYALPAAIGAARTTDAPVICVTGDGSLMMNIQELRTMRHHRLNLKLIVVDNEGYASIRNTQKAFFDGRTVGAGPESGVSPPDLAKIADAFDLPLVTLDARDDLKARLRELRNIPGPVLCVVKSQVDQRIIPSVGSFRKADGTLRSNPPHRMSPDLSDDVFQAAFGDLVDAAEGRAR